MSTLCSFIVAGNELHYFIRLTSTISALCPVIVAGNELHSLIRILWSNFTLYSDVPCCGSNCSQAVITCSITDPLKKLSSGGDGIEKLKLTDPRSVSSLRFACVSTVQEQSSY